jgi:Mg2+-importing ATPase
VESLATQTLVVFVIRTAGNPLKSRPGRPLLIAVIAIVAIAIVAIAIVAIATVLPYTSLGSLLRFTPFPFSLLGAIACLAATHLVVVQVVKNWFYRKHALL